MEGGRYSPIGGMGGFSGMQCDQGAHELRTFGGKLPVFIGGHHPDLPGSHPPDLSPNTPGNKLVGGPYAFVDDMAGMEQETNEGNLSWWVKEGEGHSATFAPFVSSRPLFCSRSGSGSSVSVPLTALSELLRSSGVSGRYPSAARFQIIDSRRVYPAMICHGCPFGMSQTTFSDGQSGCLCGPGWLQFPPVVC
jgi:hypothetical protein